MAETVDTPDRPRYRFDRMEWAGAFGDLGTLVPFVVAYIGVAKLDPLGVLLGFGVAMIAVGLFYRTPFPVQPMKAIGAVAATQATGAIAITAGSIYAAGLVTALAWLVLGVSGAATKFAKLIARPVLVGIILGLGLSFMVQGVKLMSSGWLIGAIGLAGTVLLLRNKKVPAMVLLLLLGVGLGAWQHPELLGTLAHTPVGFRLPSFALLGLSWTDLAVGTVFLALPQLPLTLGNAVIALREENNRLFPDRPVTEKRVAISTGLLNLFGSSIGGVPMCHGVGGMAGQVAFGARTGGAPIILGSILTLAALFFSGSVAAAFELLPKAVLGVILFLAGVQLALGSIDFGEKRGERVVTLMTAGFALWNVGAAFVVGIVAHWIYARGWLKL